MDILRTSLQQQSDQMLQEQESRMQRSHNSSIQALNKKYHEELKIEKEKVATYEKLLNDLKRKLKDQDERLFKFDEVNFLNVNLRSKKRKKKKWQNS